MIERTPVAKFVRTSEAVACASDETLTSFATPSPVAKFVRTSEVAAQLSLK